MLITRVLRATFNFWIMRFVKASGSLLAASILTISVHATEKMYTQTEYVQQWGAVAVTHMQTYKIPASITLAQGILESGNGNSDLARIANNHFGIKCHEWKGETFTMDDDKPGECFRKYTTADESYKDHSLFLTGRTRYAKLFTYELSDYKSWAKGLKEAGYATNPKYPEQLIELIERLKLTNYDEQVIPANNKGSELLAQEIDKEKEKEPAKVSVEVEPVSAYKAHKILEHKNNIRYIVARKGDTFYKIAEEFSLGMWQLYRYNDYGPKKDLLEEGDIVYLEPKRHKARDKEAVYVAKTNTTMRAISQEEGIRLESLLEMNNASSAEEAVQKGQKILLR